MPVPAFFAEFAEKHCSDALKHAIIHNSRKSQQSESALQSEEAENGIGMTKTAAVDGISSGAPLIDAIMFLERCPALNCGLGSNLTVVGSVECEAAYMSSRRMAYGAVAVVSNCVHPICAAKALAEPYADNCCCSDSASSAAAVGLVKPMVLAGPGADKLCASLGIGTVSSNDRLRTTDAIREFRRANSLLALSADGNTMEEMTAMTFGMDGRLDTVGGVAIYPDGMCEACVSSGGILLKREGRLGHSAQFGAAVWAEQCSAASADGGCCPFSVAISESDCGEALTRTHFAEALAQQILSMDLDDLAFVPRIVHFLEQHFVRSRRLCAFPSDRLLLGGLAAVQRRSQKCPAAGDDSDDGTRDSATEKCAARPRVLLLAFHNSAHFPFAFVGFDQRIRRFKSKSTKEGQFVCNLFHV